MNADLANRATIREMVAAFEAAERDVRTAFARIVETERVLNATFASERGIRIDASYDGHHDDFARPDRTIERMARQAWQCLVARLELRRFMSIAKWTEMERHFEREPLPPFTEENAVKFVQAQTGAAHEMLQEMVKEVFEWLRPRSGTRASEYKTNSQLEVPAKVILTWSARRRWDGSGFTIDEHDRQKFIALENVLHALDGKGTICKGYYSLLQSAIEASGKDGVGETELFKFRCCLNRNMHLTFRRLDLLARFNALAGGARLRPAEDEEVRLRAEIAKVRRENERLKAQRAA